MSYQTVLHADQRLVILRTLAEMNGYQANESILQTVLDRYGHNISRDLTVSHMQFLKEQGLISLEDVGGIQVATLNSRGEDVAAGRASVAGVKRPSAK
ncbi:ArsR family transcriptional regulator [Endozoicomonas gorgoniicola]|uniref:ArsR family transcriptional regulator n=1 Tax=Endozoicomonas gorgoniicola TaxID=1234144 RepID=A0ABT3MT68_9GAMM|nr:ArsR family transcriptional regulator [Endozoicomonas gorgoniicola]MCW7552576.1 ArsR family transcriptional regulator [Endozoicomonas gorgoniicola]